MSAKYGSAQLNPSGDWTPYKAKDEHQSNPTFDTDACYIFATLKAWIMLANLQGFDDFPKDMAEGFIASAMNAQYGGGNPWDAGEAFKTFGCVIEQALPYNTSNIHNWDDFIHPHPLTNDLIQLAKAVLLKFEPDQEWIFAWGSSYTPEQKQQMIADAAKRGAVAYSVDGNYQRNQYGQLTKPVGGRDTHWVTHLNINTDGSKTFHDQYDPFMEIVEPNYDHNAAILYFLKRKPPISNPPFYVQVLNILANHFKRIWATSSQ